MICQEKMLANYNVSENLKLTQAVINMWRPELVKEGYIGPGNPLWFLRYHKLQINYRSHEEMHARLAPHKQSLNKQHWINHLADNLNKLSKQIPDWQMTMTIDDKWLIVIQIGKQSKNVIQTLCSWADSLCVSCLSWVSFLIHTQHEDCDVCVQSKLKVDKEELPLTGCIYHSEVCRASADLSIQAVRYGVKGYTLHPYRTAPMLPFVNVQSFGHKTRKITSSGIIKLMFS